MTTVKTHDPTSKPHIVITASAAQHFLERVEQQQGYGIRLGINNSGCSGLMYQLDVITTPPTDCELITVEALHFFIDKQSIPYLKGTTIDYVQEGLNWNLYYQNPNAVNDCGCGKSFNVNETGNE